MTAAIRLLPVNRQELGEALLAEAHLVAAGRRRWAWLVGGLWFVTKEVVINTLGYTLGLLAAVAALVTLNWIGTSDDASQVVLLVLLLAAAALGLAAPRRAPLTAAVIGSALAVAGMVQAAFGAGSTHLPKPGGMAGAVTLFILLIPAFAGTCLGAGVGRLLRRLR